LPFALGRLLGFGDQQQLAVTERRHAFHWV
jgi:hypothetical protein